MPDVWLQYGPEEVMVDIRAENLGQKIDASAETMTEQDITSALNNIQWDADLMLVLLQDTEVIRQIVSVVYTICETKTLQFPRILATPTVHSTIKTGLPEGSVVENFNLGDGGPDENMVFIYEGGSDGLFGYDTTCTRLLRTFGGSQMLTAYKNREGDAPLPFRTTKPYRMAQQFTEQFDVSSIDVVSGQSGILNIHVGHPSLYTPEHITNKAEKSHVAQAVVGSTGYMYGDNDLATALQSLWVLRERVRTGGQVVLVAECAKGLGSEALTQYVEERIGMQDIRHPTDYVSGMESLLFLDTISGDAEFVLVSTLPDRYMQSIGLQVRRSAQKAVDDIIARHPRRKIDIMPHVARTSSWENANWNGSA